jgi:hypothetical protein
MLAISFHISLRSRRLFNDALSSPARTKRPNFTFEH